VHKEEDSALSVTADLSQDVHGIFNYFFRKMASARTFRTSITLNVTTTTITTNAGS